MQCFSFEYSVPHKDWLSRFALQFCTKILINSAFFSIHRNGEKCRKDLIYSFSRVAKRAVKGIRREDDCKLQYDMNDTPLESLQGIKAPGVATEAVTSTSQVDSAYKWGAGFWEQLRVLSVRTFRIRRFETYSSQNFILFMGVALIVGNNYTHRFCPTTILL